jgi:hypothetical protein
MTTLVLSGRDGALWEERANLQLLASFCAQLMRSRTLAGCLASLPKGDDARGRLFAFLQSLKRASGGESTVAMHATVVTSELLRECEVAGVDRIIVVQNGERNGDAFVSVARFLEANPATRVSVHVWLDSAFPGGIHQASMRWLHAFGTRIVVDVAPVTLATTPVALPNPRLSVLQISSGVGTRSGGAHDDIACEWLHSTITVGADGSVLPCPYHTSRSSLPMDQPPTDLLFAIASFPQTLRTNDVCLGCARRMRFTIPEWMRSRPMSNVGADDNLRSSTPGTDGVRRPLTDLEPAACAASIAAFVERVKSTRGGDS